MTLLSPSYRCVHCGESYYLHTTPATRGLGGGFGGVKCPDGRDIFEPLQVQAKKPEPKQGSLF